MIFGKWYMLTGKNIVLILKNARILTEFMGRGSAEASAEASVEMAEASGFGRTRFLVVRSFTNYP